jgi:hypothetical protein
MKTIQLLTIPALALSLLAVSCKSKKPVSVAKQEGQIEISTPFDSKEYQTDAENFRSVQSGRSPDLSTAKQIAYQRARNEMASNIQAKVKKVASDFTKQQTIGNPQEFANDFTSQSYEIVNEELSNVKQIGQKTFQDQSDKSYTVWIAIEANKKSIFEKIDSKISSDKKLKLDYDKQKFQQIYEAEMKKLEEERK